jgi:SAM-dependent methyltransferase
MKSRLVQFLCCPDCGGDLSLTVLRTGGPATGSSGSEEIESGHLDCRSCQRRYPIERGVPRMLPAALKQLSAEVAAGFGWQWNRFDEIEPYYRQQFLDWVRPLSPEDFAGKLVLDAGAGKGRHSVVTASFGAREVFAVDLGSAVEAAYRNAGHLPNVHVIQGDITHLPLKRCVDIAYSVGVLHHLPEPRQGFESILKVVKPGGRVAVWVYGREGNEWIVRFVDPVRIGVTSRLPRKVLYELARPLAYLVAAGAKGVYGPLGQSQGGVARSIHGFLSYRDYLTYISRLPLREIHSIVFDHLVTPVSHYLPREEIEEWFRDDRLVDPTIGMHNSNSWRATAVVTR